MSLKAGFVVAGLGVLAWAVYRQVSATAAAASVKRTVAPVRAAVPSIIPRIIYTTKNQEVTLSETPSGMIVDTYGNQWI